MRKSVVDNSSEGDGSENIAVSAVSQMLRGNSRAPAEKSEQKVDDLPLVAVEPGSGWRLERPFLTALFATLGVGIGLLLWGTVTKLSLLIVYIFGAFFISLALEPLIRRLTAWRLPRPVAVLVVIIALLALVSLLLLSLLPIVITELTQLANVITRSVRDNAPQQFLIDLQNRLPEFLRSSVNLNPESAINNIVRNITESLAKISQSLLTISFGVIQAFTGIIIITILAIYFSIGLPAIKNFGYQLVPSTQRPQMQKITEQILTLVGRFTAGQVALALINGLLTFILFTVLNYQYPILMAVVAFLFSLIPLVGTLAGSALIVLATAFSTPGWLLVVVIYYLVYMQVEAYILSPQIMSKAVSVPGALVVIAAVAGGSLMGVAGAIVSVPVMASLVIIVRQVLLPRQQKR